MGFPNILWKNREFCCYFEGKAGQYLDPTSMDQDTGPLTPLEIEALFYNTNFSSDYIYSRFFAISFYTLQGVDGIVIAHGILTDIVDTS